MFTNDYDQYIKLFRLLHPQSIVHAVQPWSELVIARRFDYIRSSHPQWRCGHGLRVVIRTATDIHIGTTV